MRLDGDITSDKINQVQFGLKLDGKALKRAKVSQINPEQLKIILTEGKKRQIRRMCDAVGLSVTGLKRVRIGELRLGKLAEGEWRIVTIDEFKHGHSTSKSQSSRPNGKGKGKNRAQTTQKPNKKRFSTRRAKN